MRISAFFRKVQKSFLGKCKICEKDMSWSDLQEGKFNICEICLDKRNIHFGDTVQCFQGFYKGSIGQVVSQMPIQNYLYWKFKMRVRISMLEITKEGKNYVEVRYEELRLRQ